MNQHNNKHALITGASKGLGFALARELLRENWTVVIDARNPEELEAARTELAQIGNVVAICGNVADADHRDALVEAAWAIGGLNLVVNNASTLGASPQPQLSEYPIELFEEVYRVNTFAPLAILQKLAPHLLDGVKVINVTSDAGVEPYAGWGGYGSSKAALEHVSAILAIEMPTWRIYWVDPGEMQTQMLQDAFPGEDISDRPLPGATANVFMKLINGDFPSGRYSANDLLKG